MTTTDVVIPQRDAFQHERVAPENTGASVAAPVSRSQSQGLTAEELRAEAELLDTQATAKEQAGAQYNTLAGEAATERDKNTQSASRTWGRYSGNRRREYEEAAKEFGFVADRNAFQAKVELEFASRLRREANELKLQADILDGKPASDGTATQSSRANTQSSVQSQIDHNEAKAASWTDEASRLLAKAEEIEKESKKEAQMGRPRRYGGAKLAVHRENAKRLASIAEQYRLQAETAQDFVDHYTEKTNALKGQNEAAKILENTTAAESAVPNFIVGLPAKFFDTPADQTGPAALREAEAVKYDTKAAEAEEEAQKHTRNGGSGGWGRGARNYRDEQLALAKEASIKAAVYRNKAASERAFAAELSETNENRGALAKGRPVHFQTTELTVTLSVEEGLVIDAEEGDDTIFVREGPQGGLLFETNGESTLISQALLTMAPKITIKLGEGENYIEIDPDLTQNFIIEGGSGNDTVFGGGGHESIDLKGGNDVAFAGEGNDTIIGGDGEDTLDGEGGNDLLDGQADPDVLVGNTGADRLDGGGGADTLITDKGASTETKRAFGQFEAELARDTPNPTLLREKWAVIDRHYNPKNYEDRTTYPYPAFEMEFASIFSKQPDFERLNASTRKEIDAIIHSVDHIVHNLQPQRPTSTMDAAVISASAKILVIEVAEFGSHADIQQAVSDLKPILATLERVSPGWFDNWPGSTLLPVLNSLPEDGFEDEFARHSFYRRFRQKSAELNSNLNEIAKVDHVNADENDTVFKGEEDRVLSTDGSEIHAFIIDDVRDRTDNI